VDEEHQMSRRLRQGFTLVELLVVISIIAILAALLLAGVMVMRGKSMISTTQIEIREMRAALENFKTKYGIYPPSQVTVAPSQNAIDAESLRTLTTIWPSLNFKDAFGPSGWALSGPVTLKGDQCLVLFLGGAHDASGCRGFAQSKSNPFQNAKGDHDPPFFNFKPNRLYKRDSASPFYSYGDGFFKTINLGKEQFPCYAYFAPTRLAGYDGSVSHCNNMIDGQGNFPQPYKESSTAYLNKQSFQIISAGKDTFWGKARLWASGQGILDPASDKGESMDNISDFAAGLLSGN
jgi:prepilin-type N-terminal cleavage/methylation domain-containing protein